jgi:hypothetical protein
LPSTRQSIPWRSAAAVRWFLVGIDEGVQELRLLMPERPPRTLSLQPDAVIKLT